MTPEQERKLLERIDGVHGAVRNLGDNLAGVVQDVAKMKESGKLTRSWLRRLIDDYEARNKTSLRPPRDPMPSLSADDSQGIEIAALGARAHFTGKWPVIMASVLIAAALAFGGGIAFHAANAAQQQQVTKEK